MRKYLIILTLAVAVFAAACGDDTTDTSVGPDTPDPDTTDPDTPDPDTTDPDTGGEPSDEPLGAGPYPIADLTITVTADVDVEPLTHQISCLGDTATIIGAGTSRGDAICLQLNDLPVRERLINGPATDVACTEQYGGPEVATITGTLDGEPIDTTLHRADGCGIADWALLTTILPIA